MKRLIKIASIASAGLLISLAILLFLISTGFLNKWISETVCKIANQQINAQLSIAKIEGNPLAHFYIKKIKLEQNNKTMIALEELEIKYNIWKIVEQKLEITSLKLNGTSVFLEQDKNNIWTFEKLVPTDEKPSEKSPAKNTSWEIELTGAKLTNFEAHILANDSTKLIPENTKLNAFFNFKFAANTLEFKLHQLDLNTQKPDLSINDLHFDASLIDSIFSWRNFKLQLPNSKLSSKGIIPFQNLLSSQLEFEATPFDFADVNQWLPTLHGKPNIKLEIKKNQDYNQVDFSIKQKNQLVKITGEIKDKDNLLNYHFLLNADCINGEYWTHRTDLKSNINGELELSGKGIDFKKNTMLTNATLTNLSYGNYQLDHLSLLIDKNKDKLNAKLKSNTLFGNLDLSIKIENLFELAKYNAKLSIEKLDLSKISKNKNLKSNLNIDLQAIGQGFTPGKLQTKLQLKSSKSVLFNQPIKKLNAQLAINKKEYIISDVIFEAPYVKAVLSGKGKLTENNHIHLNLKSKDINALFAELGLKPINFNGEITSDLSGPLSALQFVSDISIPHAIIDSLIVDNFKGKIYSQFSGDHLLANIDSIGKKEIETNQLLKNLALKISANAEYLAFEKYYLSKTKFHFKLKPETSQGKLSSSTAFGNLNSKFTIANIFSTPTYKIESSLNNIDLSTISKNKRYASNLNLKMLATGSGIHPKSMNTKLEIQSDSSSLFGLPLSDFKAKINYAKGEYQVTNFRLETPFAFADLTGKGNWKRNNQLELMIETTDIEKLNASLKTKNTLLACQLHTKISGPADSLLLFSQVNIDDLNLDSIRIKKLTIDTKVHFIDSAYSGFLNLLVNDSKIQDFSLKKLHLRSDFNQEKAINSFAFFANDSLQGKIISQINIDKAPSISFQEIALNVNNKIWKGGNNTNYLRFTKDAIEVNQIEISAQESALKANGIFAFKGKENLKIELQNINVVSIPGLQLLPFQITGKINSMLNISGTAKQPIIKANLTINEPKIDQVEFSKTHTKINYENEKLYFETYISENSTKRLEAQLELPMHFSLEEKKIYPNKDKTLRAFVKINQLNIDKFTGFIPIKGIATKGLLSLQLNIDSTLNKPTVKGNLDFTNGNIQYEKLGVDYHNIEMHSKINKQVFTLDSLLIEAPKGNLKLNGSLEMASLLKGELKNIDMNLSSTNFEAFNSEILKAVINSNISLNGSLANPKFKGKIQLLNSNLNTDIFLKEFNRVSDDTDQALLLTARKNAEKETFHYTVKKKSSEKEMPTIYKNLKGSLDIEIPRNTWVKGKNMNFELAGNIQLIKKTEQVDIFGSMNVKRGFYKIYGRKLEFEEGKVILTGDAELNPIVSFKIAYKFRDVDKQLRKLSVYVTGRVSDPKARFTLDDTAIEEKDAVSYLLFKKSVSQLNTGENSSLKNSKLNVAKDFALGQLSNVVKDALESTLGLDVIEISGEKGWSQGSISIGKYITNNLFLTYERTFTIDKKDKVIEPEKIAMEYQFYRSLFLQATNQSSNSGFDFILKWTWK